MHDVSLRIIRAVLSNEEASFEGESFSFGPTRTLIRPVQQPAPPIQVGGNAPLSIRRQQSSVTDGCRPCPIRPVSVGA
jgi:alkanesulfonate monooxygenase SsuD/methylene tetrahydromethanopterin reductase-like flavin-dependent oxidoreductase (luciferase family)